VEKPDSSSTKLRVVFDGSAKSTSGVSINYILHTGPSIQPKLLYICIIFRLLKVALYGDVLFVASLRGETGQLYEGKPSLSRVSSTNTSVPVN